MAIVNGTKQYPVKVVEDRPVLRWVVILVAVGVAALSVMFSHQYGHAKGMAQHKSALDDLTKLQQDLEASQTRASDLEQRIANVNLGAEVDRQANEDVRKEVISLKEEIAQLKEENSFYRGLMAPTKNKRGLSFGTVELSQTDRPGIYSYKVVLQQLATNHQLLNGSLQYKIVGRSQTGDASYNLSQLSNQVSSESIKLRFKYFQTVEGELQLPIGFEPAAIELVAKSTGKNPVTVEKRFGWLVEEVL